MTCQKKIYEIFRDIHNDIVEKIENEVYLFLEEMLISKGIRLDLNTSTIPRTEVNEYLEKMVNILSNGLTLIGLPEIQIEKEFKNNFRYFRGNPSYKTLRDWLHKEFTKQINSILFNEILNFFVDKDNNVVNKMINLDLLENSIKERLMQINESNPNLKYCLSWKLKIKNKLLSYFASNEFYKSLKIEKNDEDFERKLISFFYFYKIAEFFNIENEIKFDPLLEFLIEDIDLWIKDNEINSLTWPSTLYAGYYLANKSQIDIDYDLCKQRIKKIIVDLASEEKPEPLFTEPFKIYYLVEVMKLMDLKLNAKFREKITFLTEDSKTNDSLSDKNTDELAMILKILRDLSMIDKMDSKFKDNILKILMSRKKGSLFGLNNLDESISIESLWGTFIIFNELRIFTDFDSGKILDYLIKEINNYLEFATIMDTEIFSNIYLAISLINRIDNHYDSNLLKDLSVYIFSKDGYKANIIDKSTIEKHVLSFALESEENRKIKSEKLKDADIFEEKVSVKEKIDIFSDDFDLDKINLDDIDLDDIDLENIDLDDIDLDDIDLDDIDLDDIDLDDIDLDDLKIDDEEFDEFLKEKSKSSIKTQEPKIEEYTEIILNNSSDDIIKWSYELPNLPIDTIKIIKFNYEPLINPPDFITSNLQLLYEFIDVAQILHIISYLNKRDIIDSVMKFYKGKGFGVMESKNPDILNTYFGLHILNLYNSLDQVDIYKIHEFLIDCVNIFNPGNLYQNRFLLSSLKILDNQGISLLDYEILINKIIEYDYSIIDDYNALLDTYDKLICLKILNFKDFRAISDEYISLIKKVYIEEDGINGTITETSKVLITLSLLDAFDEQNKICNSLINFIIENGHFFNKALKEDNLQWKSQEGFEIELKIAFWGLRGILVKNPVKSTFPNPFICPKCKADFDRLPKFCNFCGHKF